MQRSAVRIITRPTFHATHEVAPSCTLDRHCTATFPTWLKSVLPAQCISVFCTMFPRLVKIHGVCSTGNSKGGLNTSYFSFNCKSFPVTMSTKYIFLTLIFSTISIFCRSCSTILVSFPFKSSKYFARSFAFSSTMFCFNSSNLYKFLLRS